MVRAQICLKQRARHPFYKQLVQSNLRRTDQIGPCRECFNIKILDTDFGLYCIVDRSSPSELVRCAKDTPDISVAIPLH